MALFCCTGNRLILGQSGSNDHKTVYHTLCILRKIININHFALATSLRKREAEFKLWVDCQGWHYRFQGQEEMASSRLGRNSMVCLENNSISFLLLLASLGSGSLTVFFFGESIALSCFFLSLFLFLYSSGTDVRT